MGKMDEAAWAIITTLKQAGAKRYVDVLTKEEDYESGLFYCSKRGMPGPLADQSIHYPYFLNEKYQDNVKEANSSFH